MTEEKKITITIEREVEIEIDRNGGIDIPSDSSDIPSFLKNNFNSNRLRRFA